MKIDLKNYNDTQSTYTGSYVDKITYSTVQNMTPAIELPGGITQNSTIEEVKAAYGEPTKEEKSTSFTTYTYGSYGKSLDISVSNTDGKITKIELFNAPKNVE